jgi:hypothetical protein
MQLVETKVKNTLANEPRKFTIIYYATVTVTVNSNMMVSCCSFANVAVPGRNQRLFPINFAHFFGFEAL